MTSSTRLHRIIGTGLLALALCGLSFGVGLGLQMKAQDDAGIGAIKTSYSFDVTNTSKVLAYADDAFTAEVLEVARTEEERSTTVWKVRVIDTVKGERQGIVLVRQLGFVDKDSKAHVAEGQPLLKAGSRQLLVTTRTSKPGEVTLIGGPKSSVKIKTSAEERRLVKEYRGAR